MNDPAVTVIALLVTGYLLLAVEVFLIPGVGVVGIGGMLCLAAGCYFAFDYYGAFHGSLAVLGVLGSTTAFMFWIPRSRFGRDVVHSTTLSSSHSADDVLEMGARGVAESDLRPAGVARFGELRVSVVTEGEFIEAGTEIVVTEVQGARAVVETSPASAVEDETISQIQGGST